jgi:hypothetical protein
MKTIAAIAAAASAALVLATSMAASGAAATGPTVLPMTQGWVYGQTYARWAADAVKLTYSIPLSENPYFSDIGKCTVDQYGKAWFVGAASADSSCSVPLGKAIVLQFGGYSDTYPCPDPSFKPAPGQTLENFLKTDAEGIVDYYIANSQMPHGLKIDGNVVLTYQEVLSSRRVSSKLFHLTGDPSLQAVDGCVTGGSQQAVVDGFWAMVVDVPVGIHSFEFIDGDGNTTSTLHVTIYNDRKP